MEDRDQHEQDLIFLRVFNKVGKCIRSSKTPAHLEASRKMVYLLGRHLPYYSQGTPARVVTSCMQILQSELEIMSTVISLHK